MGAIAKTEGEYKATVCRLLAEMRRDRQIPFRWIADNTRWQRKPRTYSGLDQALRQTAETYRRAVWDSQDAYVEIWLEKDALAGVIAPITGKYDVSLMVARGYSSVTFLHDAAEDFPDDRPVHIYHLGDFDPSGVNAGEKIEEDLREFAPDADIHFTRLAVTPEQIEDWSLPTRPTKRSDSRAARFGSDESVELDAIDPRQLRSMVGRAIKKHMPKKKYDQLMLQEEAERERLRQLTKQLEDELDAP
jgi:hypothetical protein